MALRIGVDSGGTFTDVCLFDDETGKLNIWKVPSTPDDPSRGISNGVSEGLSTVGSTASQVAFLGHGTTVATNALIEPERRADRAHHHGRLPRPSRDRASEAAESL